MRTGLVVVIALAAGCDRVLGLHTTVIADATDAAFFDAPLDAPYACPPVGQRPVFSPRFQEVVLSGGCTSYTFGDVRLGSAANVAIAECTYYNGDSLQRAMSTGALDPSPQMLAKIAPPIVPPVGMTFGPSKVLSPTADELWTTMYDATTTKIVTLAPSGTSWSYSGDIYTLPTYDPAALLGTPSAPGTQRTVLYISNNALHEVVQDAAGTWQEPGYSPYSALALGIKSFGTAGANALPNLTPDGMHLVFAATIGFISSTLPAIVYTARSAPATPFGPVQVLDGVTTKALTPALRADCGRLYFSGLDAVVYVAQIGVE